MPEQQLGVALATNGGGRASAVLNLIAEYVYDRLRGKSDAESKNIARIAELKAQETKNRERALADIEKRARRSWTLLHSNGTYAGKYDNASIGTLIIVPEGDTLVALLGPLRATLEPFTRPETARVELVPGSGSVLTFHFTGDRPDSLQWDQDVFVRVE
jgi:hypothetical protein